MGTALYSQNEKSDNAISESKNPQELENQAPVDESKETATETTENKPAETEEDAIQQPVPVYTNPAVQNRVNDQYRWTPEDPSFLYETRNIPDYKRTEEFLPEELEKVEIREQIQDEVDFRKSLGKIKIRLPDMTQTLILVVIIVIVFIYRSRARKHHDSRR